MNPHQCVYRAFAADGALLYVGTTKSFDVRRKQHLKSARWFSEVARWQVRWFYDWRTAEAVETAVIATEHPRWNVRHRSVDHPEGYVETYRELLELRAALDHQEDVVSTLRVIQGGAAA